MIYQTTLQNQYLIACENQKRLDPKTVKAYRIDLRQFHEYITVGKMDFNRDAIKAYISHMNTRYQPRTVKRKIASIRAYSAWLEEEGHLPQNPFNNLRLKLQEPQILPKTLPLSMVERLLTEVHIGLESGSVSETQWERLRDASVIELLFATGIRVSELCKLNTRDIDLNAGTLLIHGKGKKERIIQVTNAEVLSTVRRYKEACHPEWGQAFFRSRRGGRLSEQSVRLILRKYAKKIGVSTRITPHMIRHTLATLLLESDVDIRYIQQLLGHASLITTQIYTHVAGAKQREIMIQKHPRNGFSVSDRLSNGLAGKQDGNLPQNLYI